MTRDVNASYNNLSNETTPEGAPSAGRFCEVSGLGKIDEYIIHFDDKKEKLYGQQAPIKCPASLMICKIPGQ